jgi:hypothetical protein
MQHLVVYKTKQSKKRYGSFGDGGYIIIDDLSYNLFISCGVDNNVDFEMDFLNKNDIPCHAFDGTIKDIPTNNKNIIFHKINIGPDNTENTTNMHELINNHNDIFLKMDIETFEYRWIDSLSEEHMNKFKQIVIEFHFPFTLYPFNHLDIQLPILKKMSIFEKIAKTHKLVHLHANNCCGTTTYDNIVVPNVFECTYIRNDCFIDNGLNNEIIPSNLDKPNLGGSDIILDWYPFVMK